MDIISGYAAINHTRLFFETAGRGLPLIFIHGNSRDMRLWDEQFLIFARQYYSIRYDLRGVSMSDRSEGMFSHTSDLSSLMSYLSLDSAYLIGFGFGASIALELAISQPEKVCGIVSVHPVLPGYSYETSDGEIALLPDDQRANPSLHLINCPLISITGETIQPALSQSLRLMQAALPEMKKARLTGAGQLPNVSHPVQFNRIVLTFLEWIAAQENTRRPRLNFQAGYPFDSTRPPLL